MLKNFLLSMADACASRALLACGIQMALILNRVNSTSRWQKKSPPDLKRLQGQP